MEPVTLYPTDPQWPPSLNERLRCRTPPALQLLGPVELLSARRTAFYCSARTPGSAILRAHDTARLLRDEGAAVISGFHSPLEKDCIRILLRGTQPILIGMARDMTGMRLPAECKAAFGAGRLLFIGRFPSGPRVTRESALRRNELVAALADSVFFAHITGGGHTEEIARRVGEWGIPILSPTSMIQPSVLVRPSKPVNSARVATCTVHRSKG